MATKGTPVVNPYTGFVTSTKPVPATPTKTTTKSSAGKSTTSTVTKTVSPKKGVTKSAVPAATKKKAADDAKVRALAAPVSPVKKGSGTARSSSGAKAPSNNAKYSANPREDEDYALPVKKTVSPKKGVTKSAVPAEQKKRELAKATVRGATAPPTKKVVNAQTGFSWVPRVKGDDSPVWNATPQRAPGVSTGSKNPRENEDFQTVPKGQGLVRYAGITKGYASPERVDAFIERQYQAHREAVTKYVRKNLGGADPTFINSLSGQVDRRTGKQYGSRVMPGAMTTEDLMDYVERQHAIAAETGGTYLNVTDYTAAVTEIYRREAIVEERALKVEARASLLNRIALKTGKDADIKKYNAYIDSDMYKSAIADAKKYFGDADAKTVGLMQRIGVAVTGVQDATVNRAIALAAKIPQKPYDIETVRAENELRKKAAADTAALAAILRGRLGREPSQAELYNFVREREREMMAKYAAMSRAERQKYANPDASKMVADQLRGAQADISAELRRTKKSMSDIAQDPYELSLFINGLVEQRFGPTKITVSDPYHVTDLTDWKARGEYRELLYAVFGTTPPDMFSQVFDSPFGDVLQYLGSPLGAAGSLLRSGMALAGVEVQGLSWDWNTASRVFQTVTGKADFDKDPIGATLLAIGGGIAGAIAGIETPQVGPNKQQLSPLPFFPMVADFSQEAADRQRDEWWKWFNATQEAKARGDWGQILKDVANYGAEPFTKESNLANLGWQLVADPLNFVPLNILNYPARASVFARVRAAGGSWAAAAAAARSAPDSLLRAYTELDRELKHLTGMTPRQMADKWRWDVMGVPVEKQGERVEELLTDAGLLRGDVDSQSLFVVAQDQVLAFIQQHRLPYRTRRDVAIELRRQAAEDAAKLAAIEEAEALGKIDAAAAEMLRVEAAKAAAERRALEVKAAHIVETKAAIATLKGSSAAKAKRVLGGPTMSYRTVAADAADRGHVLSHQGPGVRLFVATEAGEAYEAIDLVDAIIDDVQDMIDSGVIVRDPEALEDIRKIGVARGQGRLAGATNFDPDTVSIRRMEYDAKAKAQVEAIERGGTVKAPPIHVFTNELTSRLEGFGQFAESRVGDARAAVRKIRDQMASKAARTRKFEAEIEGVRRSVAAGKRTQAVGDREIARIRAKMAKMEEGYQSIDQVAIVHPYGEVAWSEYGRFAADAESGLLPDGSELIPVGRQMGAMAADPVASFKLYMAPLSGDQGVYAADVARASVEMMAAYRLDPLSFFVGLYGRGLEELALAGRVDVARVWQVQAAALYRAFHTLLLDTPVAERASFANNFVLEARGVDLSLGLGVLREDGAGGLGNPLYTLIELMAARAGATYALPDDVVAAMHAQAVMAYGIHPDFALMQVGSGLVREFIEDTGLASRFVAAMSQPLVRKVGADPIDVWGVRIVDGVEEGPASIEHWTDAHYRNAMRVLFEQPGDAGGLTALQRVGQIFRYGVKRFASPFGDHRARQVWLDGRVTSALPVLKKSLEGVLPGAKVKPFGTPIVERFWDSWLAVRDESGLTRLEKALRDAHLADEVDPDEWARDNLYDRFAMDLQKVLSKEPGTFAPERVGGEIADVPGLAERPWTAVDVEENWGVISDGVKRYSDSVRDFNAGNHNAGRMVDEYFYARPREEEILTKYVDFMRRSKRIAEVPGPMRGKGTQMGTRLFEYVRTDDWFRDVAHDLIAEGKIPIQSQEAHILQFLIAVNRQPEKWLEHADLLRRQIAYAKGDWSAFGPDMLRSLFPDDIAGAVKSASSNAGAVPKVTPRVYFAGKVGTRSSPRHEKYFAGLPDDDPGEVWVELADGGRRVVRYGEDRRPQGFVEVRGGARNKDGKLVAESVTVYTAAKYRRQGVASLLLDEVEKHYDLRFGERLGDAQSGRLRYRSGSEAFNRLLKSRDFKRAQAARARAEAKESLVALGEESHGRDLGVYRRLGIDEVDRQAKFGQESAPGLARQRAEARVEDPEGVFGEDGFIIDEVGEVVADTPGVSFTSAKVMGIVDWMQRIDVPSVIRRSRAHVMDVTDRGTRLQNANVGPGQRVKRWPGEAVDTKESSRRVGAAIDAGSENVVYIGRRHANFAASEWGNPYKPPASYVEKPVRSKYPAGIGGDRAFDEAMKVYRNRPNRNMYAAHAKVAQQYADWLAVKIQSPDAARRAAALSGKTLVCFDHPGPCHGEVLAAVADRLAVAREQLLPLIAMGRDPRDVDMLWNEAIKKVVGDLRDGSLVQISRYAMDPVDDLWRPVGALLRSVFDPEKGLITAKGFADVESLDEVISSLSAYLDDVQRSSPRAARRLRNRIFHDYVMANDDGGRYLGAELGIVRFEPRPGETKVRIGFSGSRDGVDPSDVYRGVKKAIEDAGGPENVKIVVGGAKGVDSVVAGAARHLGVAQEDIIIHPAPFDMVGSGAGFARNKIIVRDSDVLVAFYRSARDGPPWTAVDTPGTKDTIDAAMRDGLPVRIYRGRQSVDYGVRESRVGDVSVKEPAVRPRVPDAPYEMSEAERIMAAAGPQVAVRVDTPATNAPLGRGEPIPSEGRAIGLPDPARAKDGSPVYPEWRPEPGAVEPNDPTMKDVVRGRGVSDEQPRVFDRQGYIQRENVPPAYRDPDDFSHLGGPTTQYRSTGRVKQTPAMRDIERTQKLRFFTEVLRRSETMSAEDVIKEQIRMAEADILKEGFGHWMATGEKGYPPDSVAAYAYERLYEWQKLQVELLGDSGLARKAYEDAVEGYARQVLMARAPEAAERFRTSRIAFNAVTEEGADVELARAISRRLGGGKEVAAFTNLDGSVYAMTTQDRADVMKRMLAMPIPKVFEQALPPEVRGLSMMEIGLLCHEFLDVPKGERLPGVYKVYALLIQSFRAQGIPIPKQKITSKLIDDLMLSLLPGGQDGIGFYEMTRMHRDVTRAVNRVRGGRTAGHQFRRFTKPSDDLVLTDPAHWADGDLRIVLAKARALAANGVHFRRYDNVRPVLEDVVMRRRVTQRGIAEARRIAAQTGEDAKVVYDAWVRRVADREAVSQLREVVNTWKNREFARGPAAAPTDPRASLADMVQAHLSQDEWRGTIGTAPPRSGFQMRSLEKAYADLAGSSWHDKVALNQYLGSYGKPPLTDHGAMRKYMVDNGFWTPREESDISDGLGRAWNIDDEAKFWWDGFGEKPMLSDRQAWARTGAFDQFQQFATLTRRYGAFDDRFSEAMRGMPDARTRQQAVTEGDDALGIKRRLSVHDQRRMLVERYGDSVGRFVDAKMEDVELHAAPWLMNEAERGKYIANGFKDMLDRQGILYGEDLARFNERLAEVLRKEFPKWGDPHIESGAFLTDAELNQLSYRVLEILKADLSWLPATARGRGKIPYRVLKAWSDIWTFAVVSNPAWGVMNVPDAWFKWAYFSLTDLGGVPRAAAKDWQDLASGAWRAGPSDWARSLRLEDFGEDGMFSMLGYTDGMPWERLRDPRPTRATRDRIEGFIGTAFYWPATLAAMSEKASKLRMAHALADGFRDAARARGLTDEAAEAFAKRQVKRELDRRFPSVAQAGPVARVYNMLVPFGYYHFKNRVLYVGEALGHPWLLTKVMAVYHFVSEINRQRYEEMYADDPEMKARGPKASELGFIPIPGWEGAGIDFSQLWDARRGLNFFFAGRQTPVDMAAGWFRVANASTIGVFNTILNQLGVHKDGWRWNPLTRRYEPAEVPLQTPWGTDGMTLADFFGYIGIGEHLIEMQKDGNISGAEMFAFLGRVTMFREFTMYDKKFAAYQYVLALRDAGKDEQADLYLRNHPEIKEFYDAYHPFKELFVPAQLTDWYMAMTPEEKAKYEWSKTGFANAVRGGWNGFYTLQDRWKATMRGIDPLTEPDYYKAMKKKMDTELAVYIQSNSFLLADKVWKMGPEAWAAEKDSWVVDRGVDQYFAFLNQRPKRADYKTATEYANAVKAFEDLRTAFLAGRPDVQAFLDRESFTASAAINAANKNLSIALNETAYIDAMIEQEKAKKTVDYEVLDKLYASRDRMQAWVERETWVAYAPDSAEDALGKALGVRAGWLPNSILRARERQSDVEKAERAMDQHYVRLMKDIIKQSKASGEFDGLKFMRLVMKNPWVMDRYEEKNPGTKARWEASIAYVGWMSKWAGALQRDDFASARKIWDSMPKWVQDRYFAKHPGKREQWAQNEKYSGYMKRYAALAAAGNYEAARKYFDGLPAWVRDRYYAKHPDKKIRDEKNAEYIAAMQKWNSIKDYDESMKYLLSLPDWMQQRVLEKHPDLLEKYYANVRYIEALQPWIDALKAKDYKKADAIWDSLPTDVKERYYGKHPDAKVKAEQYDAYSAYMAKWVGLLEKKQWDEADKYFASLPSWAKERYYARHPEKRDRKKVTYTERSRALRQEFDRYSSSYVPQQISMLARNRTLRRFVGAGTGSTVQSLGRLAAAQKIGASAVRQVITTDPVLTAGGVGANAEYSGYMKRWIDYLKAGDSDGADRYFYQLPQWVRERYFKNHPESKMSRTGYADTGFAQEFMPFIRKWVALLEDTSDMLGFVNANATRAKVAPYRTRRARRLHPRRPLQSSA